MLQILQIRNTGCGSWITSFAYTINTIISSLSRRSTRLPLRAAKGSSSRSSRNTSSILSTRFSPPSSSGLFFILFPVYFSFPLFSQAPSSSGLLFILYLLWLRSHAVFSSGLFHLLTFRGGSFLTFSAGFLYIYLPAQVFFSFLSSVG